MGERSDTHHGLNNGDGFRERSTYPTRLPYNASPLSSRGTSPESPAA